MVKRFKKYQSGEGARFITRRAALKKLQLSLRDFRSLCIIKGIYPREPKHRLRAQRGKTGIQTLYLKKDIQFLLHEPIIWKMRELKVHLKRIKRAKSMKEYGMVRRYGNTIPVINIDHIVKERYPTFIDAIRDLDDCLSLCFLFATMPHGKRIPPYLIGLCRRLTVEFMHYVIAAKALRYAFISIKGIYFQAEIKGQNVTWIVPHNFAFDPTSGKEVDFSTMSTFADFYTTVLGFVNYRLYHTLNLHYPPLLKGYTVEELESETIDDRISLSDRVAALNIPLQRSGAVEEDTMELDQFPMMENAEAADKAREKFENVQKLKKLFEGLKVFLSREVPREPLVFILRCFGAQVSWDPRLFPGIDLFSEDDESITHQIVDRPCMEKQYLSRYYVQPQWVFDCVNARRLLPVEKYFIGAVLPPHLSPFTDDYRTQRYVPPEERAMKDPNFVLKKDKKLEALQLSDEEEFVHDVEDMLRQEKEDEMREMKENNIENDDSGTSHKSDTDDSQGEATDEDDDDNEKQREAKEKLKNMKVISGSTYYPDKRVERKEERENFLMKEKMIRRKYRNLYKSMKQARICRQKEIQLLKYKRRLSERKELEEKKATLRAQRMSAALTV